MKEYLLVDGYNIIHSWEHLKELLDHNSLDSARLALVEELSNFSGYTNNQIIVIFDGHHSTNLTRTYEQYHNIEVVFTKKTESADQYIERIAQEVGREVNITVATSDGMEQLIVLARGATRKSARELLNEINEAKKTIQTDYIDNQTLNKKNLLESHLNQDVIDWMEKLRRN